MYEGWKKEVLRRVEKNFDKEISDTKSWIMERTLYSEGIDRNKYVDTVVLAYLQKQKCGYLSQGLEYKPTRHSTRVLMELVGHHNLRKETPYNIIKADLVKRYWHHYFKKYYNDIVKEIK